MKKNIFEYIIKDTENNFNFKKYKFLKNKKVLITGATGMLGSYFISFFLLLLKSNNKPKKITLFYRQKLPTYLKFLNKNKKIKLIKKDLSNLKNLNIDKQDYIIYLAGYGQPGKFITNPIKTYKINTSSLELFVKKIKKNGRFLFLSSSEIYSGLNGKIDESKVGTTNTSHPRACYIESKRGGETILNNYKNILKFKPISARLCLGFGPGVRKDDERVLHQFIEKALKYKKIQMLDSGKSLRSYIYITDVLKMLVNILFYGKGELYNIGGKKVVTIRQLAKKISKILKVKFHPSNKDFSKNLGKAPKNAFVSIKNYEKEFGKIRLININEGLKKTIGWHKII